MCDKQLLSSSRNPSVDPFSVDRISIVIISGETWHDNDIEFQAFSGIECNQFGMILHEIKVWLEF